MKKYDKEFLEKTDVKNIIEHLNNNGLEGISTYDTTSILDQSVIEFVESIKKFVEDYVQNENPKNFAKARTDLFKKRYDKFLMCYDVLQQNNLVTEELKKIKEDYDRIMLNKVNKLIKEIQSLSEDQGFEKQAKLESMERILETLKLSAEIVSLSDKHAPLFKMSKEEFDKLKSGAIKQKKDDDKKLEDTAVVLDKVDDPKKDDNQVFTTPITNGESVSLGNVSSQKVEKKSRLEKRLESLKIQLVPGEEIQKLKQETEVLYENIQRASKEGNNPQLVNELYEKYKQTKSDLELALDNNEKVNKKIARLEGAKKLASLPRKEFNKLKTNAKIKAAAIKKQIHEKMDPIVNSAKKKVTDAKDFVVDKATDAKDFVVDKATDARDFVVDKVDAATSYVSEKKDELTDKVVTGYNNVGVELQNKVDSYNAEVKTQEQLSSDAISEALAHMGNDVSIDQIENAVDKITKEASKDSKKAERKVALYGTLQKLHSIPKSLKDAIKSKVTSMGEEQMSTGRAM